MEDDEHGVEHCVEDCSKPIGYKMEGERATEQRLANLERRPAQSEGKKRVLEFPLLPPAIPELRCKTWLEYNHRNPNQTRFPAVEILIREVCSEEANNAHDTAFDGDKPLEDNNAAQSSQDCKNLQNVVVSIPSRSC